MKKFLIALVLAGGVGAIAYASLSNRESNRQTLQKKAEKHEKRHECRHACPFS